MRKSSNFLCLPKTVDLSEKISFSWLNERRSLNQKKNKENFFLMLFVVAWKLVIFFYLGKYFCYNCHEGRRFYLPSSIILHWDFSRNHKISNFASNFLRRQFKRDKFHIEKMNPRLFKQISELKRVKQLRWSLFYLETFISTCSSSSISK